MQPGGLIRYSPASAVRQKFCHPFRVAHCFAAPDGTRFVSRGFAPNPKTAPAVLLAPLGLAITGRTCAERH
jgi:hypothetical protein